MVPNETSNIRPGRSCGPLVLALLFLGVGLVFVGVLIVDTWFTASSGSLQLSAHLSMICINGACDERSVLSERFPDLIHDDPSSRRVEVAILSLSVLTAASFGVLSLILVVSLACRVDFSQRVVAVCMMLAQTVLFTLGVFMITFCLYFIDRSSFCGSSSFCECLSTLKPNAQALTAVELVSRNENGCTVDYGLSFVLLCVAVSMELVALISSACLVLSYRRAKLRKARLVRLERIAQRFASERKTKRDIPTRQLARASLYRETNPSTLEFDLALSSPKSEEDLPQRWKPREESLSPPTATDDWVKHEESGLLYHKRDNIFYDPDCGHWFDPKTNLWFDPAVDEWYDRDARLQQQQGDL